MTFIPNTKVRILFHPPSKSIMWSNTTIQPPMNQIFLKSLAICYMDTCCSQLFPNKIIVAPIDNCVHTSTSSEVSLPGLSSFTTLDALFVGYHWHSTIVIDNSVSIFLMIHSQMPQIVDQVLLQNCSFVSLHSFLGIIHTFDYILYSDIRPSLNTNPFDLRLQRGSNYQGKNAYSSSWVSWTWRLEPLRILLALWR